MSLSIRQWLAEHNIELTQLRSLGSLTTGVAFRLVQDMQVKSLTPFDLGPFAEVLELPLAVALPQMEPISQLTVELLRVLSRKKPLKRNEGTWLAFQIAYLRALQKILEQEHFLRRTWLDRATIPASLVEPSNSATAYSSPPLGDPQLQALLKTLRPGRLSDTQAEQALSLIAESFLVQQMNNVAIAWLMANGTEETEAKLIVQRLVHGLPGYLLVVVAENALPLAQLQRFVRLGNLATSKGGVHRAATIEPLLTEPENLELEATSEIAELPATSTSSPNPIDLHREHYRASLLQALSEPMLGTLFALKDLYVPLQGREVKPGEKNAEPSLLTPDSPPVELIDWVTSQLADLETVAVIEAPPGQGKTSFCQMWAAQVAQELYPSWMPILIRLRDATLGQTLEQTLDTAFPAARFTCADGWLSSLYPPCLLILDGLNELPRSPQTERHLSTFLDQVRLFLTQSQSATSRPRHKIVLTCRSHTLVGEYTTTPLQARTLPAQFRRITINSLEQEQLKQWFKQWSKLQSKSIAQAYFTFLKQNGVFHYRQDIREFATLVHQPLMLFLLGLLHRDGRLDESIFSLLGSQVRFEIYDRVCRWLLGETPSSLSTSDKLLMLVREGLAHASRSPEAIANLLQGRSPQELRHQMQVAALTILQSGRSSCPTDAIEQRSSQTTALSGRVGERESGRAGEWESGRAGEWESGRVGEWESGRAGERENFLTQNSKLKTQNFPTTHYPLKGLPALYFRALPVTPSPRHLVNPSLEFSHPSLGEYLGAEAIAQQLKSLTQRVPDVYGEVTFAINSPTEVAQHLYHLLSFGILSTEIEESVIERLRREETRDRTSFSFEVLFERLYRFYRSYCRGRWMDEGIAHAARSQLQSLHNSLNALQVDAAVGLNVFLLLCACHREAKIVFWPCGDPTLPEEFNPDQLLTLISRTAALSPIAFWQRLRHSLSQLNLAGACLHHAILAEANFWKTDLFAAELVGANLANANLQEANLSWANLTGANLSGANLAAAKLDGANLTGANLEGANLQLASLTNACLFQARLDEATKLLAQNNGALFSLQQYQACQKAIASLEIHRNVRISASQEADSTLLLIERATGSSQTPDESDIDSLSEEETVFLE